MMVATESVVTAAAAAAAAAGEATAAAEEEDGAGRRWQREGDSDGRQQRGVSTGQPTAGRRNGREFRGFLTSASETAFAPPTW